MRVYLLNIKKKGKNNMGKPTNENLHNARTANKYTQGY